MPSYRGICARIAIPKILVGDVVISSRAAGEATLPRSASPSRRPAVVSRSRPADAKLLPVDDTVRARSGDRRGAEDVPRHDSCNTWKPDRHDLRPPFRAAIPRVSPIARSLISSIPCKEAAGSRTDFRSTFPWPRSFPIPVDFHKVRSSCATLYSVCVYDNTLYVMEITGKILRDA